ncbi:P-loop containing nucleoside triphosphate hydrolase protein [Lipomyces oligophaga]|uniref:P-loop containing nucleoside triphosphate hydrolase protein n=1 Tax=Lipomyces oligophaga TaxID=45792 RepID=UPI0034CE71BD
MAGNEKTEISEKVTPQSEVSPLIPSSVGQSKESVLIDEFSELPPSEAAILREQVVFEEPEVNFIDLFRYADSYDKLLLIIGFFSSVAEGCMRPLMTIVFGLITDTFANYARYVPYDDFYYGSNPINGTEYAFNSTFYNETSGSTYSYFNDSATFDNGTFYNPYAEYIDPDYFQRQVNMLSLYFVYIGIADVALSYLSTYLFIDRGDVISARIREKYLEATLRQNVGYFDKVGTGEVTSRISADAILIQEGISEKVGYCIANFSTLIAGFIVGMIRSYILALILSSMLIMMMFSFSMGSQRIKRAIRRSLAGYSVGGTLAEEVLASVRNVQAFGIQERLAAQYDKFLVITEKYGIHAGLCLGVMHGFTWLGIFGADAIAFFVAPTFILRGTLTVGRVVTVLLTITHGAFAMSHIAPHFKAFTAATAAATKIYSTIDRPSAIDSQNESGLKLENLQGEIELHDVKLIYPSRPKVVVMDEFNLKIPAGKTVALVGASGSGKSTIVGLIERFYKPVRGYVTLDGHDICNLNLRWLRSQISLVSQEPTLFSTSVYENVEQGLIGSPYEHCSPAEKNDLVMEACKQANAYSFIVNLPAGFDTQVGERGFLLSGGQKQRIAIARAIVSNPKILLLDEATSALDTKSEGIVQEALDRASKNRTTIVIAHRLSTIKEADLIVVMRRGTIIERGTHNELLAKQGEYYELVQAQQIEKEKKAALGQDSSSEADSDSIDEKAVSSDSEDSLTKIKTKVTVKGVSDDSSEDIDDLEAQAPVEVRKYTTMELVRFISGLTTVDNRYLNIGIACSIIQGLSYVALGEFYGHAVQSLQFVFSDPSRLYSETYKYAGLFIFLAFLLFFASLGADAFYSYVAQRLIRRIRYQMFRHMLRQDISFFDRDENTTGTLTMSLARDGQSIDGLSGATFGQIMNSIFNVIGSAILAIVVAYKLGLVAVACVPLMVVSGFFRFWVLTKNEESMKKSHEASASYACEATSAIKTVISLTREQDVTEHYRNTLAGQTKKSRPASRKSAILYAFAQGMQYFITALTFWWGGTLLRIRQYGLLEFYITYMAVIFGAQGAGIVFSFASDMGKARLAAENVKTLFDSVPEVDSWSEAGNDPTDVKGDVEFKNVVFRYPTRRAVRVLNGLSLKIKRGQYVALVGASGCGKSTTIGLIESFYRPDSGSIMLDGVDISTLNVNSYRSNIALVSQEPTLYAGSVRYNVQLGTSDEDVSDEAIIRACKQANIHEFIMSLPDGYDTLVGSKGTLLSGGQKQRIAIARALIRQPKILLLDEATSALDSESEKIVQAALDQASKGRTTIAIAHRLSTIQNADIIYVFDGGVVVEAGSHQELLAKRGKYYELVQMQALESLQ